MDRQQREAESTVALNGGTRRACNNNETLRAQLVQVTQERDAATENLRMKCEHLAGVGKAWIKAEKELTMLRLAVEPVLVALRQVPENQHTFIDYIKSDGIEVGVGDITTAQRCALLATEQKASEIDRLRQEQATSVLPLIGPLLDAWNGMPNDLRSDLQDQSPMFYSTMQSMYSAMDPGDNDDTEDKEGEDNG